MRGMYTNVILQAIAERPGIRAVEIADKVDCEVEAVERSIREEIDAGNVRREIITAPNGKPTCAFWMKGVNSVAVAPSAPPIAPVPPVAQKVAQPTPKVEAPAMPEPDQPAELAVPEPTPAPAAPPVEEPPVPVRSAQKTPAPPALPARTKVDIIMDYLRNKADQSATDDEIRKLVGLRKDQAPAAFLGGPRIKGQIHKDGKVWRLGPRNSVGGEPEVRRIPVKRLELPAVAAPPAAAADVDTVNSPSHYRSHPSGIECIDVTEHMGFNIGNAVKYLWRCDLKANAIEDLKKAAWYINREIAKREAA